MKVEKRGNSPSEIKPRYYHRAEKRKERKILRLRPSGKKKNTPPKKKKKEGGKRPFFGELERKGEGERAPSIST